MPFLLRVAAGDETADRDGEDVVLVVVCERGGRLGDDGVTLYRLGVDEIAGRQGQQGGDESV